MKTHLLTMADYHAWAFEVLYDVLAPISDEHYRRDCGLFFRTIHGTLNHLLVADRVWFGRCTGVPFVVAGLDSELEHDRDKLKRALHTQSARWCDWIRQQSVTQLNGLLRYTNMSGTAFQQLLTALLLHVFNHGTHHRGQVSAAITACGYNAPEMDLIWYLRSARAVNSGVPTG